MDKLFRLNLNTKNFIGSDLKKIQKAGAYVGEFINSDYMKNFIRAFYFVNYSNKKIGNFHYTDLSNSEVLAKILNGSEILTPEADGEADIQIELDTSWTRNVIGYTYPTTAWQWIYAKFFNSWSAEEIAGNIMHEYMHKLGFDHEYNSTYDRQYSVPYALGYECEKYCKEYMTKSYFQRFKAYFS